MRAQAIGKSRGGRTTKIVLTAADEDTALAVDVIPGQAGEAPRLEPLLDRTLDRVGPVDELVADRAFDGDPQRHACVDRDVCPVTRTSPGCSTAGPRPRAARTSSWSWSRACPSLTSAIRTT